MCQGVKSVTDGLQGGLTIDAHDRMCGTRCEQACAERLKTCNVLSQNLYLRVACAREHVTAVTASHDTCCSQHCFTASPAQKSSAHIQGPPSCAIMQLSPGASQQHTILVKTRLSTSNSATCCACCGTHLDADRQVAEERRLDSVGNGAELENGYVGNQHSVALCPLLGLHQILDAQRYCLLVEAPKQLQQ